MALNIGFGSLQVAPVASGSIRKRVPGTSTFNNPSIKYGQKWCRRNPKIASGRLWRQSQALRRPGKPLGRAFREKGVIFEPKNPPEAAWAPHSWLLREKGMLFWQKKAAGGSLGTALLAFKEK